VRNGVGNEGEGGVPKLGRVFANNRIDSYTKA